MLFTHLDQYRDHGLLLLRLGLGLAFLYFHGVPKLLGGPERWAGLAGYAGIEFLPTFFGFMAMFSEVVGALLLMAGLLFRPAVALLFITMAVAVNTHLMHGEGYSYPLEMAIVFLALFFIGPGRFSVDARWAGHA